MQSSLNLPSASRLAKFTTQSDSRCAMKHLRSTDAPELRCSSHKSLNTRSTLKTPLASPLPSPQQQQTKKSSSTLSTQQQQLPSLAIAASVLALACASPAAAFELHMEPSNALSLPTWAVHTSSVLEWLAGMGLMWRYGQVSGNPRWKGMTWGMLPCLGSAMCACTWHFFYNAPELEFLVTLQAALTVLGNFTCWIAAYRIYESAQTEEA